jgi:hypothetical protein
MAVSHALPLPSASQTRLRATHRSSRASRAPLLRRLPAGIAVATFVSCVALSCLPIAASAAEPVDVLGTWYVLVHYTDTDTANPDADRWLDLVWVLSMKGSRLEWKEFPIVVFEDQTGRFEAIPGNPKARTLRAWEPTPAQLEAIDAGPRVNDRGSKTKTLRGSPERGWESPNRMASGMGVNVMSYQEVLSIEQPTTLPKFIRADMLGNQHTRGGGGQIVYETLEVRDGGDTLVGRYERDGHRTGVFRARRTPEPRGLPEQEGTPNERLVEELKAAGGVGAMGLGKSSGGPREGFDEGNDF